MADAYVWGAYGIIPWGFESLSPHKGSPMIWNYINHRAFLFPWRFSPSLHAGLPPKAPRVAQRRPRPYNARFKLKPKVVWLLFVWISRRFYAAELVFLPFGRVRSGLYGKKTQTTALLWNLRFDSRKTERPPWLSFLTVHMRKLRVYWRKKVFILREK